MKTHKLYPIVATVLVVPLLFAQDPQGGERTLEQFLKDGKPIIDVRLRYEHVGQTGLLDADAFTVRTRLGYQTADWNGFQGLVEMEDIRLLNDNEDVNLAASNLPAGAGHAVVPDPETTELNRVWLSYTVDNNTFKAGRERIKLDDDRFIGNVGWRQNEQTYDTVSFKSTYFENFAFFYAYIWQTQRIFGGESANPAFADFEGDSHIINASYTFDDWLKLTGFAYLLQLENGLSGANLTASGDTYGLRATGAYKIDNHWTLSYEASYATQSDNGGNPAAGARSSFDLNYYKFEAKAHYDTAFIGLSYEVLEGDGTNNFNTPLATVHAFQGWSDVFLTPSVTGTGLGGGVEDLSISAGYKVPVGKGLTLNSFYHWFSTESPVAGYTGDYGTELNAVAIYPINKHFKVIGKYSSFDADIAAGNPITVDVEKFWLELNFSY